MSPQRATQPRNYVTARLGHVWTLRHFCVARTSISAEKVDLYRGGVTPRGVEAVLQASVLIMEASVYYNDD